MGPFLFGRGFCGWACWTAMVLDYLPYKRNKVNRVAAKWELLRYVSFGFSLLLVLLLWFYFQDGANHMELAWLIGGNAIYFSSAIILAFAFKDNRAFCKYLCPITVLLKITSRFSFLKIEGDKDTCTQCGVCNRMCPMDIDIMRYVNNGERVLSTECISCLTCTTVCPEGILDNTFKIDFGGKEYINRR
jgi:polyferredoxin